MINRVIKHYHKYHKKTIKNSKFLKYNRINDENNQNTQIQKYTPNKIIMKEHSFYSPEEERSFVVYPCVRHLDLGSPGPPHFIPQTHPGRQQEHA